MMCIPLRTSVTLLQPGKRVHLAGIGGVSMCPLAEVLQGMGLAVQGSDMTRQRHRPAPARPWASRSAIGHSAENLKDCDSVIRTAAVHDGNPEIAGAIARGIPVYERAQAWGAIMQHYRNALCISGTHGKTTTTSMCTHIFMAAQTGPHRHDRRHAAPAARAATGWARATPSFWSPANTATPS